MFGIYVFLLLQTNGGGGCGGLHPSRIAGWLFPTWNTSRSNHVQRFTWQAVASQTSGDRKNQFLLSFTTTMTFHAQSEQTDIHLEFEVPPTAISQDFHSPSSPKAQRPFSIDLSLELERQLDMESPPVTPSYNAQTHDTRPKRESLDPQVLAHIVMQLRHSLAEMTKERDDLLQFVSGAHSKEAELKDTLQAVTDKATELEEELMSARRKMKDDEDAIAMLRTKVEESRYVLTLALCYCNSLLTNTIQTWSNAAAVRKSEPQTKCWTHAAGLVSCGFQQLQHPRVVQASIVHACYSFSHDTSECSSAHFISF